MSWEQEAIDKPVCAVQDKLNLMVIIIYDQFIWLVNAYIFLFIVGTLKPFHDWMIILW